MSSNDNRNCSSLRDTTAKSIQNVDKELLIFLLNFYYKFSGKLLGFLGPTSDFQNLDLTTLSMKKNVHKNSRNSYHFVQLLELISNIILL